MKSGLLRTVRKLNKNRKQRKWWQRAVHTMAMVVVFCTTYALILPAITMEQEVICGIEAHEHGESCYAKQTFYSFACGLDDQMKVVHSHNTYCYNAQGELICMLPEIKEHTHEDACYEQTLICESVHTHSEECATTEEVLVCTEEVCEAHTHGESCVTTENVLVCAEKEYDAHTHSEDCAVLEDVLVCTAEESEDHVHSEACYEQQSVPCELTEGEGHVHGEDCYEEREVLCELAEGEGHSHGEDCYEEREIPCELTEGQDHVHTETCYEQGEEPVCGKEEIVLHTHEKTCYDEENVLICVLPEVVAHNHTEACLVENESEESILICELPEHVHEDSCYPVEEEDEGAVEYICGFGIHAHVESCYNEAGELICTIPEHAHEAACVVADLDLTADMEIAEQWEASLSELELSGDWAQDVLTIAKTQLGYQESEKNCILADGELKGYTRYGQWYGEPYADWDDMFISFCLHYAEIAEEYMPYESDTARWVEKLTEQDMFTDVDTHIPVVGEMVFLDTDEDETADFVCIAAELMDTDEIRLIAGNTGKGVVDYITVELDAESIVGYAELPENPLTQEQWNQSEAVRDMLAELPEMENVRSALQTLNDEGDRAGYEALRQETVSRTEAVRTAYDALTEMQKARVGSLDKVTALEDVCGGGWQELPALTDDSALLTELTVAGAEVIRYSENDMEDADSVEAASEYTVRNQDVIRYNVTAAAESYYSDLSFGEARIKMELLLPLSEDKARFDTEAMAWLEDSELTTETRDDVECQVLTGYKRMTGTESKAIAIPGSFTETVVVEILNMTHGEQISLIISAAMEYSTWEGQCEDHQVEEKITVQTQAYTLNDPLPEEERGETFLNFRARIEELCASELSTEEQKTQAGELLDEVVEDYYEGLLTVSELEELGDELRDPLGYFAEYATGIHWMLDLDGTESAPGTYTVSKIVEVAQTTAVPPQLYASVFPSETQIRAEGGEEVSADNKVMVSKTIAGTEAENVFDITLEIITQDKVTEVYEEPDMAVVVVMDISNTMKSTFGNTSRYEAAMEAGTDFLNKFAENNSGVSKVGYVAFNTHAHEIFGLSTCDTAAQASALASEMKTDTGKIINASGYAESNNRFTNMEAGLKMAYDMLAAANNEHKYIIFLSDGFPTTYLKSNYNGWDPNCSSGTKDTDGVFYDDALNKYCLYGTSYSDTAAIKARTLAVQLKSQGVNIFSIGVDVGGQTLSRYHAQSYNTTSSDPFSTVERREETSWYQSNGYEIGIDHDILWTSIPESDDSNYSEWTAQINTEAGYFKNWLKGTATTGIGSGYYYDSTNTEGLKTAYESIFAEIKKMNSESAHLDWVAADPMGDMGVHDKDAVEFIGFWNVEGELVTPEDVDPNGNILSGTCADGEQYENTASFDTEANTIHWDLKKSRYVSQTMGEGTTNYRMWITYRIRLQNEDADFIERQSYATNDTTTLTYRLIDQVDGVTSITERRTVEFPIPAVEGYLGELNFKKTMPSGTVLAGAEFTLTHDEETCGVCTDPVTTCAGTGIDTVTIEDQVAASGEDGIVSFTNIPSGHVYKLTETKVPDGYVGNDNIYQVIISYDTRTVKIYDAFGRELEETWDDTIVNEMYYELPNTGGMGTFHLTFGGALMILGAGLMYICITGRKRRKGGR